MVSKRRSGIGMWKTLVLAGALACIGSAYGAQPNGVGDVKQLVADLGSSEIMKREEAMRILSSDVSLTLPQLEELLRAPDLTPEQRCRISQAAKLRFMASPRPAMGVQFDSRLQDRVAIETVYPKFPAAQFLQPGDIIVSCNGERLHSRSAWLRLGAHIFSREPGETISVVVRRGAEKLEFQIPLGNYSDLATRNAGGPGEDRLERAWELRSRRYLPEARPAIDPKVAVTDWKPEPSPLEVQKIVRYKAQVAAPYRPRLAAGGEPRGGELDYEELLMMSQQNPGANRFINRAWAQQQLAQQGIGPGWTNIGGIVQTTQQELSMLETRRLSIERSLEALNLPGGLKPQQVAQLEERFQMERMELARIKKQIDAIRAEAAEEQAAGNEGQGAPAADR